MKKTLTLSATLIAACFSINAVAENKPVGITADLMSVTICLLYTSPSPRDA